jgi:nucleoside-diphosphate-sugar epimerase
VKALVTGGGGFVGRRVVAGLLERGWAVRSLGRSPQPDLEALGVEVVRGDLVEAAAVTAAAEGCEAVFHVAANAGVWGDRESYFRPNVLGTRNVLAACRKQGVGRLVYTSTPSVVFDRRPIAGGNESLPYARRWLCHYARTKALAEREVLAADGDALATVALRPHLVWGPGDPHLLPRVVERAARGRLRIVGDGSNRVDVSHVENVADAHLAALDALDRGVAGGRAYFISQGEPVRLWPWLNGILGALGIEPVRRKVPLPAAYAAGAACEALWRLAGRPEDPPMTRFVALQLGEDHFFDIAAARRDLGYEPRISTDEGLGPVVEDLARRLR